MAREAPIALKNGAIRADQQGVGRRAITTLASGALFIAALAAVALTTRATDAVVPPVRHITRGQGSAFYCLSFGSRRPEASA